MLPVIDFYDDDQASVLRPNSRLFSIEILRINRFLLELFNASGWLSVATAW
ncbi:MAG: hypothetical protein ACI8XC_001605, partial [Gammaproteobacteria bacterium]